MHTQNINDPCGNLVNVSSVLRFIPKRDYPGLVFRCEAVLHLGPKAPEIPPAPALDLISPSFCNLLCKISFLFSTK